MLGGIVLGLAESFASAYLQTEYKDVVAFALLILVPVSYTHLDVYKRQRLNMS